MSLIEAIKLLCKWSCLLYSTPIIENYIYCLSVLKCIFSVVAIVE